MAKIKILLDLNKLKGVVINAGMVCIPMDENSIDIYKHKDGTTSVNMTLNVFLRKERGKYGETHIVKNSLSRQQINDLNMGNTIDNPILGNVRQYEVSNKGNEE